jgi:hypothetical protein
LNFINLLFGRAGNVMLGFLGLQLGAPSPILYELGQPCPSQIHRCKDHLLLGFLSLLLEGYYDGYGPQRRKIFL